MSIAAAYPANLIINQTSVVIKPDPTINWAQFTNYQWNLWTVELKSSEIKNHSIGDVIINGPDIWQIMYIDKP